MTSETKHKKHPETGKWSAEHMAEPLSPEALRIKQEQEKTRLDAERKTEALKESKWTYEDLNALMLPGHGQYKMLNGADIKDIDRVMKEEIILDKKMWDPREMSDDLTRIESVIHRADIVVMKNGKAEKKEKMPPQFIDAIYGVVLTYHILGQWFYITTDASRQPILHDTHKPARTDQMQSLQSVLSKREWQWDSFHTQARDKSVIIPKIDTYIASAAFYSQKWGDLKTYRAGLESKIHKDPNTPLTYAEIEASGLNAGEKSFLLSWYDRKNDFALEKIQERQKAGIMEIKNNPAFKTLEQKQVEMGDNPTKLIWPTVMGAAAIGLLYMGLKMIFGKDSKVWERLLGGFVLAGGLAFGWPVIKQVWDATGAGDKSRQLLEGSPVLRDRGTTPIDGRIGSIDLAWVGARFNRLSARLSGPQDWDKIIMNPQIGDDLMKYPVGAMLASLNPEPGSPYKDYATDPKTMGEIKIMLEKLPTETGERERLNQLLKQSFERYKELHPADDIAAQKKLKLPETIQSIDNADGWINAIPQWKWWIPDALEGKDKSIYALKIIARKAGDWGNLTVSDLDRYFVKKIPNSQIKKLLSTDPKKMDEEKEIMKKYVEQRLDVTKNGPKTLREVIQAS